MPKRPTEDRPYEGEPDPDLPAAVDGKQDDVEITKDES